MLAPERRTGQVVLGALLVVVTAALVARTALRSGDPGLDQAQAAPPPLPTTTAHPLRPRVLPIAPLPPRTARPRLDASAAPLASAPPHADAGAPAAVVSATVPPPPPPAATTSTGP